MDPRQLDLLAQEHSLHGMGLGIRQRDHFYIAALALLISLALVWRIGFRHDLLLAVATSIFWTKLLFPLILAMVALGAWRMTLHPGFQHRASGWLIATCIASFWFVSLAVVLPTDRQALMAELFGTSWQECMAYIALHSLPMTACLLWISRRYGVLCPVDCGFFSGLSAGCIAASLYAVHCREPGLLFLGSWYVLGAFVPALAGASMGRVLLTWRMQD